MAMMARRRTPASLAKRANPATLAIVSALFAIGPAAPALAQSRGEMLYTTYCQTCHTTQVHWRASKLATDWSSLEAQVRRWQGTGRLGWSDDDIRDTTRYLNETIYRFPQTADTLSGDVPPLALSRDQVSPTAGRD